MNCLYQSIGISKQAFHKHRKRTKQNLSIKLDILEMVYQIREDHPTMNSRDMYYKLSDLPIGRTKFEQLCKLEGLSSPKPKNRFKTTDSSGVKRFDNHIKDLIILRINQVWQSDITYYYIQDKFYYLTFIIDSFSRRILGHSVSKSLKTRDTTIPALIMAIALRSSQSLDISGLILHSDGGGQYYDDEFLSITAKNHITNSMCKQAWENGKAERINGIIKNNYLIHRDINSYEALVNEVDRTILLYNEEKPHVELKRLTPINFENNYICKRQQSEDEKSTEKLKCQSQSASHFGLVCDNNLQTQISHQN